jgi:hypothetical protein
MLPSRITIEGHAMKLGHAIVAVITALALTGCGTPATLGAAPVQTGSNRPSADPEAAVPDPAETTISPDELVAFDSPYSYGDGLQVTVSKGKTFRPSQYAAGKEEFKSFVKYTVVIVNGTEKVFDPSSFMASVQSSNVEGSQVFDGEDGGMGGGPTTKLLKGREAKFVIGFGVEDPKDVVLQITPSFEHNVMLFN